jgi:RimJ/RimL family protein N-acetyltransferase
MPGGVIQTERLTLRPLTPADAGDIATALADWNVARWLTRVPFPYALADAEAFIASNQDKSDVWAIADATGFLGIVGMQREFGYWLARRGWGQGYATEMGQAVLLQHFAGATPDSVPSGYVIGNDRSCGVLEKLGFRVIGHTLTPTARGDNVVIRRMILTSQDWQNRLWITTPRLVIRPLLPRHAQRLAAIGGQPDVARMLGSVPSPWPTQDAATWISKGAWRGRPGFRLGVWLKGGSLIGMVGLGGQPVSAAYFIGPDHAGHGYATEAMQAMLADSFGRFNIHTVLADHFTDNPVSGRVLQKLGFEKTGEGVGESAARVEPAAIVHYRLIQPHLKA